MKFQFYKIDVRLAYSRLSDFQHHWQDILVGALFGSLIAFVTFKFILNWRNYTTRFLPYTIGSSSSSSERNPPIYYHPQPQRFHNRPFSRY